MVSGLAIELPGDHLLHVSPEVYGEIGEEVEASSRAEMKRNELPKSFGDAQLRVLERECGV